MNRIEIVQTVLNKVGGKTYLEIGVQKGVSFFPIKAKRKIGIDPKFNLSLYLLVLAKRRLTNILSVKNEKFFGMTSDEFFHEKYTLFTQEKIDVALIDGLHTYKQSLQDVLNCLSHLNERGVIVIHDCNPSSETIAYPATSIKEAKKLNLPGWDGRWSGDVWKTVVYLRSFRNDLCVFVLDCDYGIAVVARGKPENMLTFAKEEIEKMSYKDLASKRNELLNLKEPNYLYDFLKGFEQVEVKGIDLPPKK